MVSRFNRVAMKSEVKGPWNSKLCGVCLGCSLLLIGTNFSFAKQEADLTGLSARDVSICRYSKDLSLNLEIQARRLRLDHERRGFFRIGVLPIFVAEDVRIQIASPDYLSRVLPAVEICRPSESVARRVEIRHLGISFLDKKFPRLNAAVARPQASGSLELTDVCLIQGAEISKHIPHAVLWMSGQDTGKITWNTQGHHHETSLFSPQPSTRN